MLCKKNYCYNDNKWRKKDMLNDRQMHVIDLLNDKKWITGKELARRLVQCVDVWLNKIGRASCRERV